MQHDQTTFVDELRSVLQATESCYQDWQNARDRLEALRADLEQTVRDLKALDVLSDDEAEDLLYAVENAQWRRARSKLADAVGERDAR